ISPPSPSQGAVPSPQSYLPPTRAVSFEVALKEQPTSEIVPDTSSDRSRQRIALPPIARSIG
ncbi:MAG: hypothetical protein KY448_14915, partial [Cyanobacteria bacterium 0813]|nr:hypothetical protein [Cyanobacteria bacterium 0813]